MLQGLLEDRFRLRFHAETRQMTTLALVRSKGALKIEAARVAGQKERAVIRRGEISGTNIGFGHFVTILQAQLNLPIANESGLSGEFDFALKYDPADNVDAGSEPSVFAAVEEQLGLKLERRKSPVKVMVIDGAEKPLRSEN